MLESGIGRAYNVALASLPNFSLPGDLSPSARYWARDIVSPEWTMDANGMVAVPRDRPGLGVDVDVEMIESLTVRAEVVRGGDALVAVDDRRDERRRSPANARVHGSGTAHARHGDRLGHLHRARRRAADKRSGHLGVALIVWVVGGVVSFLGALTYAELGAMTPDAGGLYAYIRDAFGPLPAFLYGWTSFLVIASGSVATLAVAFSTYLGQLVPIGPVGAKVASTLMIVVITVVNVRGTRQSATVENSDDGDQGRRAVADQTRARSSLGHAWPAPRDALAAARSRRP